jgi:type I restriction enzyme S subunit
VKAGWDVKPLEQCLARFNVPAKIQRTQFSDSGAFPIISQEADFINGYWDRSDDVCRLDGPVVVFGDHTQVLKFVDFDFVIGADGVKVLKPDGFLNPRYLYYFLMANRVPSLGYARHYRHLKELNVRYPSLDEQRRIVAILDEAFEGLDRARANAEANLASARELFEVIKATALGQDRANCEVVTLADVSEIASSLVDPRHPRFNQMPHLGAGNMVTGTDELVDVKTAAEEKLISGKYLFDKNAVLYSKIRPYLRKAARPDFAGLCSADVYPLTPKAGRLDRDFLFHLLLGRDFTEYAIRGSDRAGMPKVNRDHLFAYSFQLPPIDAQRRIAALIDEAHVACQTIIQLVTAKVVDLADLRQSILQKAFAGDLT